MGPPVSAPTPPPSTTASTGSHGEPDARQPRRRKYEPARRAARIGPRAARRTDPGAGAGRRPALVAVAVENSRSKVQDPRIKSEGRNMKAGDRAAVLWAWIFELASQKVLHFMWFHFRSTPPRRFLSPLFCLLDLGPWIFCSFFLSGCAGYRLGDAKPAYMKSVRTLFHPGVSQQQPSCRRSRAW